MEVTPLIGTSSVSWDQNRWPSRKQNRWKINELILEMIGDAEKVRVENILGTIFFWNMIYIYIVYYSLIKGMGAIRLEEIALSVFV